MANRQFAGWCRIINMYREGKSNPTTKISRNRGWNGEPTTIDCLWCGTSINVGDEKCVQSRQEHGMSTRRCFCLHGPFAVTPHSPSRDFKLKIIIIITTHMAHAFCCRANRNIPKFVRHKQPPTHHADNGRDDWRYGWCVQNDRAGLSIMGLLSHPSDLDFLTTHFDRFSISPSLRMKALQKTKLCSLNWELIAINTLPWWAEWLLAGCSERTRTDFCKLSSSYRKLAICSLGLFWSSTVLGTFFDDSKLWIHKQPV